MSGSTAAAERNPWITRLGAIVFLALAVGLVVSVGSNARMQGYGQPRPVECGGYHQAVCAAQVSDVFTKPTAPRAGKGFAVHFQTSSGGKYAIKAKRKGSTTSKTLSTGATGVGEQAVTKLGKKLKAGEYRITVKVTNVEKSDTATDTLRIKKP